MEDDDATTELERSAPRQATVMRLIQTADELRRYFAKLYEPCDVTSQQYNVLRILRGTHPIPLPTMEISERMIEKTPGITRLLDRLEEKGLVARVRPPGNRRTVLNSISEEGLALLQELDEPVRLSTETLLDGLSEAEAQQLNASLAKIRRKL